MGAGFYGVISVPLIQVCVGRAEKCEGSFPLTRHPGAIQYSSTRTSQQ